MEIKQPKPPGAMPPAHNLAGTDKQIGLLAEKFLPAEPHLFCVPTRTPYLPVFPHENQNTPFGAKEVSKLQYMTLISDGSRGIGETRANWFDELNNSPPASVSGILSSKSTPMRRDPSKKMTIADYKNLKTTGAKPSPRPAASTPTPENKQEPAHAKDNSNAAAKNKDNKPVGVERHNGVGAAKVERKTERPPPAPSALPSLHTIKPPIKHPLPPRPQSPKSLKRSRASDDAQAEKRVKIGPSPSQKPARPAVSPLPKKAPSPLPKKALSPLPKKASSPLPKKAPSPLPKKAASIDTKLVETKTLETPLKLPKILSPLPHDLLPDDPFPLPPKVEKLKSEPAKSPNTPSQNPKPGSDTIVVKADHLKVGAPSSSPLSTPPKSTPRKPDPAKSQQDLPPFKLPPLLPYELPEVVEEELRRLQEKAEKAEREKSSTLNSVEARHEKVRQPGAPGVAQKKAKIGHPPKPVKKLEVVPEKEVKSLIVKLKYNVKKSGKNIARVLALPSTSLRKAARDRDRSTSAAPPVKDSDSEDDVPLATKRSAAKAPAGTTGKKRPSDPSDREPAAKRAKPEHLDIAKPSTPVPPAFKSPSVTSASKEKKLLTTPKKAMSDAMRRVDSSEGAVRTPQAGNTSTPASAERPRANGVNGINGINGTGTGNPEYDRARHEDAKYHTLGTALKRKMSAVITQQSGPTENDHKTAMMNGIEGLLFYMLAFHARDKMQILKGQPPTPTNWEEYFTLWTYVYRQCRRHSEDRYPALVNLLNQIGAISAEQLSISLSAQDKESPTWSHEKYTANQRERVRLWNSAHSGEQHLQGLGGLAKTILGPWNTVKEAVGFGGAVLDLYKRKVDNLTVEWTHNEGFPRAYMTKFLGEEA